MATSSVAPLLRQASWRSRRRKQYRSMQPYGKSPSPSRMWCSLLRPYEQLCTKAASLRSEQGPERLDICSPIRNHSTSMCDLIARRMHPTIATIHSGLVDRYVLLMNSHGLDEETKFYELQPCISMQALCTIACLGRHQNRCRNCDIVGMMITRVRTPRADFDVIVQYIAK